MQLAPAEKALIVKSFRMLAADAPAASNAFYRHLFRIMPDCEKLFVADIAKQGAKLAQTLQVIVDQLDNWGMLRVTLGDLAVRHLAYGVASAHYSAVGQALLAMLSERLGPFCTAEILAAWRKAYTAIQDVMIESAYRTEELSDDA